MAHITTHLRYQKKKCVGVGGTGFNNPFEPTFQLDDAVEYIYFLVCVPVIA
jgi:hypothetical protein